VCAVATWRSVLQPWRGVLFCVLCVGSCLALCCVVL
jgi:hypothetical protein